MRRGDLQNARELRARLKRSGGTEWVESGELRTWFGGKRLSRARRHRIASALAAQRIDVYPPLLDRRAPQRVRLEALPDEEAPSAARQHAQHAWGRVRVKLLSPLGAAITLAASVVTLIAGFLALSANAPPGPGRMSGELNVAVAPFSTNGHVTEEGIALADDAAQVLALDLSRPGSSPRVEVRGPEDVGAIDGTEGARALARRFGADIVVYGNLEAGPDSTRLQPAFYLNAAELPWARTLGGAYTYGGPIAMPYALAVSPAARARIRAALIQRTKTYAQAFLGVGDYLLHASSQAELHLRQALTQAPTSSVAALLRLLLGNIADQKGRVVIASHDYSLAIHDPSTRTRAELGLADVGYQVAHKHCRAGEILSSRLIAARRTFARVLRTQRGIAAARKGSPLAAKAAFGVGQVDLCLSAAGHERRWLAARKELEAVITAYRPKVPELRDDAAEAHAGIGLYDLTVERPPAAYEDARDEYRAASHLATIDSRRAYFNGVVGFADTHLGRYSSAIVMYKRGARLAGTTPLGQSLARRAKQLAPRLRTEQ